MQLPRAAAVAALIYGFVLCPPALAQQSTMPDPAAPPLSSGELAPDSPLAPLPDLEVPWPEIEDAAAIPGEADSAVPPDQAARRYSIRADGLDQVAGDEIGRAHVRTPVTNAQPLCSLLL